MKAHASPAGPNGTRQRHPEGTGEHPLTDRGQLILAGLSAAAWIADSFVFRFSAFLARHVPVAVRWPVGAAVMIVAAVLALKAHRAVFEGATRSARLITEGAYAVVRHPLYLGSWLFFAGLTLTTFSLASAAVNVVMLAF